ncbi:MAG TPA: hypothetical protein VGH13_04315 [Xanthobacteraceae bacterium]
MNDPHIESLIYRIRHNDSVTYASAAPMEHAAPDFKVGIEKGRVQIDLIGHYTKVSDARAVVEPFLRAWELNAALNSGPGEFEFVFERANIIERAPKPGVVGAAAFAAVGVMETTRAMVSKFSFPPPPLQGVARDATVDLMFERYCRLREQRTTLSDAANYCLTALEMAALGRKQASARFNVDLPVLRTLGELAATKGGKEARKAKASEAEYTPAERDWLTKVLPLIIRRAAEVAFDPDAPRQQISMADLPQLS